VSPRYWIWQPVDPEHKPNERQLQGAGAVSQGCFKIWRRVSEGHTSAHTWWGRPVLRPPPPRRGDTPGVLAARDGHESWNSPGCRRRLLSISGSLILPREHRGRRMVQSVRGGGSPSHGQ